MNSLVTQLWPVLIGALACACCFVCFGAQLLHSATQNTFASPTKRAIIGLWSTGMLASALMLFATGFFLSWGTRCRGPECDMLTLAYCLIVLCGSLPIVMATSLRVGWLLVQVPTLKRFLPCCLAIGIAIIIYAWRQGMNVNFFVFTAIFFSYVPLAFLSMSAMYTCIAWQKDMCNQS